MRRERIEADQSFFRERLALRAGGGRRSLARARALAAHLGVDLDAWADRAITVVGSKGKGTAATFASATLAAAGLRVGTLTSPGLRSNRERIRVDGEALTLSTYVTAVTHVAQTLGEVGGRLPADGYLSPSGLWALTALRHFADTGCDVAVLEAGMGGASDEVSLLGAPVVAITAILGEHLGVLGSSIAEIAREKAGVIGPGTRAVVTAPQPFPEAEAAIAVAIREAGCFRHPAGEGPVAALPAGLAGSSAAAGVEAGRLLLEVCGRRQPDPKSLQAALRSIRLPGRLSRHRRGSQSWIVDCATNPTAIAAALAFARDDMGPPSSVLTFIPRHREAGPLLEALAGERVVRVTGGAPGGEPGSGASMRLEAIDLDSLGPRVLCLGPVYFVGEVLATLGVDCERSFSPAAEVGSGRSPAAVSGGEV